MITLFVLFTFLFYVQSNLSVAKKLTTICRVLLVSGHLSSVWGHSVHFVKFLILRLSKSSCSNSFHPISTSPYRYLVLGENTNHYFFWLSAKFKKNSYTVYDTLKFSSIAIIDKALLVSEISSGKKVKQIVKSPGPLVSFCP